MSVTLERSKMSTDVLVVGSGAAGAMAAIKAMAEGAEVLVVTKGPFPSGNSSIALAGYAVALGNADPRDNPQVHFEDSIKAGNGLSNQKLVRTWVTKIVELTREMDSWGIDLIKDGDKFAQRPWEGHTYPRMVHHHLATGKAVMKCLGKKSQEIGVKVLEHTIVGGLLKKDGMVVGAWGIQYQTGQLLFIEAKAVILTTGGMGHLFPITDNVKTITGEGYTMAFRAGAELIQMEFCHFLPTVCYPEEMKMPSVILGRVNGLINKGGARLYNAWGERFMKKYYPDRGDTVGGGEELTRAIGLEIYEGKGSPHGGIYLDVSDVPPEMQKTDFADIWDKAARASIDLGYQPIELAPYPHDLVGGIKIDETGSTGVPGLFAAGEAAGGAHGASRFGGSAVADALAFGAISGRNAAHYAGQVEKQSPPDEQQLGEVQGAVETLLSRKEGIKPSVLTKSVQTLANDYLNVGRDEKGLKKALGKLEQMEREMLPQMSAWAEDRKESAAILRQAIEVDGQLELARAIATAALQRQESRGGYFGGHYRTDHPSQDDENWLKNIVLKREHGAISCRTEPPVTED
ncbi:Fumarate reductase flavoprotein subunit [subsurface metagenome]